MSRAFAPSTVANIAIGFDILGMAVPVLGDRVSVNKIECGVVIDKITGIDNLPMEAEKNTAGMALLKMIEFEKLDHGFSVSIEKGIPLGSGLGGSAASAVAAVVAANELLDKSLPKEKLLRYALYGESVASGSVHADNVAASLYGGLTAAINLTNNIEEVGIIQLPVPDFHVLLIHPDIVINTRDARRVINPEIKLKQHIDNSMRLTAFIAALYTDNNIEKIINDGIIEPQRSKLIPDFDKIKKIAMENGAIACSISGAGPTIFVIGENKTLNDIKQKLMAINLPYNTDIWIDKIDNRGAYVI